MKDHKSPATKADIQKLDRRCSSFERRANSIDRRLGRIERKLGSLVQELKRAMRAQTKELIHELRVIMENAGRRSLAHTASTSKSTSTSATSSRCGSAG